MRSVFIEDIKVIDKSICLKAKEHHHLINVIRLKTGEKIQVFDRNKRVLLTEVYSITKKEIIFKVISETEATLSSTKICIAFGKLKKDAFDLSIKQLVEIGINEIFIFESQYSQNYPVKLDRLDKIIISAMEQSNNYIFPQIKECTLVDLLKTDKNIIYFTSNPLNHQKIDTLKDDSLIIIGPEGGLNNEEEIQLIKGGAKAHHLPTNILRAQTAVSFCSGFVLGSLER